MMTRIGADVAKGAALGANDAAFTMAGAGATPGANDVYGRMGAVVVGATVTLGGAVVAAPMGDTMCGTATVLAAAGEAPGTPLPHGARTLTVMLTSCC